MHVLNKIKDCISALSLDSLNTEIILTDRKVIEGKIFYCIKGTNILHNEFGPAVEHINEGLIGYKAWYINGELHREDGPAIELPNGYRHWFINGRRHREDGPAFETDRLKEWHFNGILHREDAPAIIYSNGDREWFFRGKYHRLDGPAIECANGHKAWWINGEQLSAEEFNERIK